MESRRTLPGETGDEDDIDATDRVLLIDSDVAMVTTFPSERSQHLGGLQIAFGCFTILIDLLGIIVGLLSVGVIQIHFCFGIWISIFYILAGGFCRAAAESATRCRVVAALVLAALGAVCSLGALVFGGVTLGRSLQLGGAQCDLTHHARVTSLQYLCGQNYAVVIAGVVLVTTTLVLGMGGLVSGSLICVVCWRALNITTKTARCKRKRPMQVSCISDEKDKIVFSSLDNADSQENSFQWRAHITCSAEENDTNNAVGASY